MTNRADSNRGRKLSACRYPHVPFSAHKPRCHKTSQSHHKNKKNQGLRLKHLAWGRQSRELRLYISKTTNSLWCSKVSCTEGVLWRTCETSDLLLISMDCGPTLAHKKSEQSSASLLRESSCLSQPHDLSKQDFVLTAKLPPKSPRASVI